MKLASWGLGQAKVASLCGTGQTFEEIVRQDIPMLIRSDVSRRDNKSPQEFFFTSA
jgi:hypothetical protein